MVKMVRLLLGFPSAELGLLTYSLKGEFTNDIFFSYTERFISYRKYLLQITQLPNTDVISEAPSMLSSNFHTKDLEVFLK